MSGALLCRLQTITWRTGGGSSSRICDDGRVGSHHILKRSAELSRCDAHVLQRAKKLSLHGNITKRFEKQVFQAQVWRDSTEFGEALVGQLLHCLEGSIDVGEALTNNKQVIGTSGVVIRIDGIEGEEVETEAPKRKDGIDSRSSIASHSVTLFDDLSEFLDELRVDAVDRGDITEDGQQHLLKVRFTDVLAECLHHLSVVSRIRGIALSGALGESSR